tara:strand:+ start:92 stop:397 length:306 start_codon:yes stop_codon:yes gene_type:complete
MKYFSKILLLSTAIFIGSVAYANTNDLKAEIQSAITTIDNSQNISKEDKSKFLARFSVLIEKLENAKDAKTKETISKDYTRLVEALKDATGFDLNQVDAKN